MIHDYHWCNNHFFLTDATKLTPDLHPLPSLLSVVCFSSQLRLQFIFYFFCSFKILVSFLQDPVKLCIQGLYFYGSPSSWNITMCVFHSQSVFNQQLVLLNWLSREIIFEGGGSSKEERRRFQMWRKVWQDWQKTFRFMSYLHLHLWSHFSGAWREWSERREKVKREGNMMNKK